MFRSNTKTWPKGQLLVTTALLGIAGCGGGGEEAEATAAAATTDANKPGPPTVKGLGSQAKDRQGALDAQAAGGAPAPAANSTAIASAQPPPADPNAAAREAMAKGQGGGRRSEEREAIAPGADAPGATSSPGYVPGYAQGGAAPGATSGAPGAAMRPPGGYGGPGMGMPGSNPGGGNSSVLFSETAFLENGEALTVQNASQPGGVPGEPGAGVVGGDKASNDFSDPSKAVESFLSAAQARNGESIGAAISRRAPGEAKAAGLKKILTAAVERKLSDEEIGNIADTFADYKVMNLTPGKSSGSVNITIGRERKGTSKSERSTFERRIMRVHRDGNTGWKVLDFGNRIVND